MEQLKMRKPVRRLDLSINMEATGANIRKLVKASGYSVRDIMAITGISTEQAVYKWFRGESIPAIETMLILSKALGIEIRELLVIDGDFHFFEDMQLMHLLNSELNDAHVRQYYTCIQKALSKKCNRKAIR